MRDRTAVADVSSDPAYDRPDPGSGILPTLQETRHSGFEVFATEAYALDDLLSKEWLLTNGRGAYASSTVVGCNTRSYHGLLVGSLDPPVNRIMAMSGFLEQIIRRGRVTDLSTFEFPDRIAPEGYGNVSEFRRDIGVHFKYSIENLGLVKSIYLARDSDTVAVVYSFSNVHEPADFVIRPFAGLRDFHSLQRSNIQLRCVDSDGGILISRDGPQACSLFMKCPALRFEADGQWWFNFTYRHNVLRGQRAREDLWSPGVFSRRIKGASRIVFRASLGRLNEAMDAADLDIDALCEDLKTHAQMIAPPVENSDRHTRSLYAGADQFIVSRRTRLGDTTTILAGYPWFADWGRDTFIALPGLLLSTRRFDLAKSVLTTFADAADDGMIPNRFDDRTDAAHFNSVDASLWFVNAAFQYLAATNDSETFTQDLLPVIRRITESYSTGTRFGIHADDDGLITAGDKDTQLTWMDAKYDGVSFTPRYGKAVEVNSLWYNALCLLARFHADSDEDEASRYESRAADVAGSFCRLFWNERLRCLNDCILPDGSADESLRPNQIFAVSLSYSPLTAARQKSVVDVVQKELLTPYGLRTLSVSDERYQPLYRGPQSQRDKAYHQGTIWPYLIGPFVEAFLKVNDFSETSRRAAAEFIRPLLEHLHNGACLGSISEIFEGSPPHKPRGCFAQAWSVAELLRAYRLIHG